jgi:hypothetical protein
MWVAIEQIQGFPGLQEQWMPERPFFERAYDAGPHGIIRMRFTPQDVGTGMDANIPLMPRAVSLLASASLVDATGAVILFGERGIVRPARSFYQEVRPEPIDVEAFLLTIAGEQANELVAFRTQMQSLSILIPPPMPAPATGDEGEGAVATMSLAAADEEPEEPAITYGALAPGEDHVEEQANG